MSEIDDILKVLLEDEDELESKDVYFSTTEPLAVDLGPGIWGNEAKLFRAFNWMTRIGLAPKFGSVPIGYYQQDQAKGIDKLREIADKKGIDLRWVKKRGSRLLAWDQDKWVPFAAILGGELQESADDDFDIKDVSMGGSLSPFEELAQLFDQGILELSGNVVRTNHHYVHERTTEVELYNSYNWPDGMTRNQSVAEEDRTDKLISDLEEYIQKRLYDWNHKIYQELEASYEAEHEEEVVADNIRANNYTFNADGKTDDAGGFQYDQLDDEAKEKAREWWNETNEGDNYWSEPVIAEWRWLLRNKGFNDVEISYSGFWSQGDGASFTASNIDFRRFFSSPDPLDFPEQEREQLDEAKESDFEVKDVALPSTPMEVAQEIAKVLSVTPGITDVAVVEGAMNPENAYVNGSIKTDHWDGGYALDKIIFRFMDTPSVEITRNIVFAAPQDVYPRGFMVSIKPKTMRETLEERYGGAEGERAIFYHGTTSKLLPKILAQGLIPEPKARAWSEDPNAGMIQPTRKSLSGVYVTTNLMTAISSAGKVSRRDKVNPLIVIMELQPRSLVGDEDSLGNSITALARHISDHVYSHIWPYFAEVYRDRMRDEENYYGKLADKAKVQWADDAAKQLLHKFGDKTSPELATTVRKMLFDEGYRIMLERMVSYSTDWDKSHYRNEWEHLFGTYDDAPPVPDANQAETKFLDFKDRLSRTMKASARPLMMKEWSFNTTGRSLEPIGFSGSNHIVCIAEEVDERDPEYRSRIVVHYGQPPEQFIKDWKEAMGPLDKPDSIVYKNKVEEGSHWDALQRTGFWGEQAAGCIFLAQDTGLILLPRRSGSVEQPHTWGTWGGAVEEGEAPASAAEREAREESGYTGPMKLTPLNVFRKGTFSYHNFLALVPKQFEPNLRADEARETEDAAWVKFGDWPSPLHFGLADLIRHSGDVIQQKAQVRESLHEATEDEEADLKELSKLDQKIYLNYTYDDFYSDLADPEQEPVWENQGPFVSVKSAYDWAKTNLRDQREKITYMEISRAVLGAVVETWVVTQDWELRQDFGQGYRNVNLPESEDDDFEVKDVALPGQRWIYRIFRFPTCASINYYLIDDPNFQCKPEDWPVLYREGTDWPQDPIRIDWNKVSKPVGGHTFPKRTSDKDLHQIAQAQIRQFQRAGEYPRENYANVWEWLRDVRNTGPASDHEIF